MATFDLYAAYYDLLYRDKDYGAEAAYVLSLLPSGTVSVLELGCGTGGHAFELANRGCAVHGIDVSPGMVERADSRRSQAAPALQQRLRFETGDVRSFRAEQRFDAVVSLFHVMSYQTTNDDLRAAFMTARRHLAPGGVFMFDFWYGPAVLSDRPRHVTKRVSDDRITVERVTTPKLHVNDNRVDVTFDVSIRARDGSGETQLHEVHAMRYLFLPEIDLVGAETGFLRQGERAWMRDEAPTDGVWYASVVLRAI